MHRQDGDVLVVKQDCAITNHPSGLKGAGALKAGKPVTGMCKGKRCENEMCPKPTETSQFNTINAGCRAGGRDWSHLVGTVLCQACYNRYYKRGTLDRTERLLERPTEVHPSVSHKRCDYENCARPTDGSTYREIVGGCSVGDQNWSSVEGMILCHACYSFYGKHGTLHRVVKKLTDAAAPSATKKPNVVQSSCSYEYCSRKESKHFYHIRSGFSAGGQDWSRVLGMLLCHACYNHYSKNGSLERHEKRRRLDA